MNEYDSEVAQPGNGINTSQTTALGSIWQFAIDRSKKRDSITSRQQGPSPRHLAFRILATDLRGLAAGGTDHDAFPDHVDYVGGSEGIQEETLVCFAGGEDLGSRLLHSGVLHRGLPHGAYAERQRHVTRTPFREGHSRNLQDLFGIGEGVLI